MKEDTFISTEVDIIPIGNRFVVYAPLRRLAFLANTAVVNFLYRLRNGQVDNFSKEEETFLRFLQDVKLVGEEGDTPITAFEHATFKPTAVTLFLTTRCNLRCIYCYASAGTRAPVDMELTTAKRGIDFVYHNAVELGKRSFEVAYHGGGEPTLNWNVLVQSLAYAKRLARKNDMEVYATAATNGVFSEAKRMWIIKNLQGVSLSMDGLPEVHDFQCPLRSGGPSSNTVFRTLEAFEKTHFPYGIRMTVTASTVKKVPEGVRYLLDNAHPK